MLYLLFEIILLGWLFRFFYQPVTIIMSRGRTNSSLSSFENQENDVDSLPTFHPRHREDDINSISNLRVEIEKKKYEGEEFSEFEDQSEDKRYQESLRRIEQSTVQIITNLKQQISRLKADNHKLTLKNTNLHEQLQRTKHSMLKLEQKIQTEQYQQLKQHKKHKIETLIQQIGRIKQNTNKLRVQSDKDAAQIALLKDKIEQYEKEEVEWAWKNKFIELFIDMLRKISDGIDQEWNDKKKIQIGWKIVKNMIDKGINSGIKVPKIQRNRL